MFARLLLIHVDDPVAVLRRLWGWVAPGGHLVIQDHDVTTGQVVPPLDSAEELRRVIVGAFDRAGRDLHLGVRLPALHAQAGIGAPDGTDVAGQLESLATAAPKWEAVYRSKPG